MSTKQSDTKHLATVIRYFKRKRGTPSTVARACKGLLEIHGSPREAALATGGIVKKPESISVWARFGDLPPKVQRLFDTGKIGKSLIYDLISMASDAERVTETAEAVAGLPHREAKRVIQKAKKSPDADIEKIKQDVSREFEDAEIFIAMIALDRNSISKIGEEEVVRMVEEWLESGGSFRGVEDTNHADLSPYLVKLPRRLYLGLIRRSKNPGDVVGRIIRERMAEE